MPNFFKEDLLFVEKEATKVLREELKARAIFPVDTNYDPNASEIGYDIFDINGSAKIFAGGGNAKDIPFVGEEKKRETQPVYTIASGIKYEKAERDAVASARANGKGSNYNLDSERPATARRFVAEKENQIAFTGDANYNLKGVLDASFYGAGKGTKTDMSTVWASKTPAQILGDIRNAVKVSSKGGLFGMTKKIVMPFDQFFLLTQPFDDGTDRTIMDWLKASLPGAVTFEWFNVMQDANNGASVAGDAFFCFTPDPKLVKLAITSDLQLLPPVFDLLQNSEQALTERTPGMIVKHPASLFIGYGI